MHDGWFDWWFRACQSMNARVLSQCTAAGADDESQVITVQV